jgi:hypothetical protein
MRMHRAKSVICFALIGTISATNAAAYSGNDQLRDAVPMYIVAIGALFAAWMAFRILVTRKKK